MRRTLLSPKRGDPGTESKDWRRTMAGKNHGQGNGLLERHLTADDDAPAAARLMVREFIDGLDEASAANLYVAVSELVTNAVVHGGTGPLTVRLGQTDHVIRIEVSDPGTVQFAWDQAADDGRLRAHGLEIVEAFTNRFGIEHTPNTLAWCE